MSAQQNNPPSLQARREDIGKSFADALKRATRTETRSCAIPQRCRWRPKTSLALAFQRTIQDVKIADGTYVGNPATVGEIKRILPQLVLLCRMCRKKLSPELPSKTSREQHRAIPKENAGREKPSAVKGKPAVSKYAEIGSVKMSPSNPRKIAGICVEKKIANADEEIAILSCGLRTRRKKGDADTAIWANARIMTERRKNCGCGESVAHTSQCPCAKQCASNGKN